MMYSAAMYLHLHAVQWKLVGIVYNNANRLVACQQNVRATIIKFLRVRLYM